MVRAAASDPPEIDDFIWRGFEGAELGFDIGANCGQSIRHMLQVAERVVAFEPHPESFAVMEKEWHKHPLVTMLDTAVSAVSGKVQLAQLSGEQAETGQLVTPGTAGMEWEPEDWRAVSIMDCRSRDLDSMCRDLGSPDFLKVDTEGHEVHVLLGARQLIAGHRPDWLIEFHSPRNHVTCMTILEALSGGGYTMETVRHPHYAEGSRMWRQHGWIKAIAR